MQRITLCLLLLCGSASAQQYVIVQQPAVVAQPVVVAPLVVQPAQVVWVPRYFPLNRLLFGCYRPVIVPQQPIIIQPMPANGGGK